MPLPDCNTNGVNDSVDIATGTSLDENHNGIPDECPDEARRAGNIGVRCSDAPFCPGDGGSDAAVARLPPL
jgi:hypothetical protein